MTPEQRGPQGQRVGHIRLSAVLGEVERARPLAEELFGNGWQGLDLLDLCREHGITESDD